MQTTMVYEVYTEWMQGNLRGKAKGASRWNSERALTKSRRKVKKPVGGGEKGDGKWGMVRRKVKLHAISSCEL